MENLWSVGKQQTDIILILAQNLQIRTPWHNVSKGSGPRLLLLVVWSIITLWWTMYKDVVRCNQQCAGLFVNTPHMQVWHRCSNPWAGGLLSREGLTPDFAYFTRSYMVL